MPEEVITEMGQVTPQWLTAVLSADGALTGGSVTGFDVEGGQGNWSANAILSPHYGQGAAGSLPGRLFLKMVDADLDDEFFGVSEVDYYLRDYADVPDAPIIHCYHAAYSEELKRYHLLLDDLTETHIEAAEKMPSLEYGQALADGLAAMHARWWGGKRLAEAGAPLHNPSHIRRFVDIAEPGAGHIIEHFSGELKAHWPDLIWDLYDNHPAAIIERTGDENGFTIIHGDVGHNNVLVPREGDRPIYIIDRQPFDWSLTTWLGVFDLAYAMVLDWPVALRRRLEMPVLRRYHERLLMAGIDGDSYSWKRLYDDYRLCVAMGVYIATEYCRGGINKRWVHVWVTMLKRALTACDDLECYDLW